MILCAIDELQEEVEHEKVKTKWKIYDYQSFFLINFKIDASDYNETYEHIEYK